MILQVRYEQDFIYKMDNKQSLKGSDLPQTATKPTIHKTSVYAYSPQPQSSSTRQSPQPPFINPTSNQSHDQKTSKQPTEPLSYSRSTLYAPLVHPQVDILVKEHRAEVQTLLFQINRLNHLIVEQEELKKHDISKAVQDYQATVELRMSSIRQNQGAQAEVFQLQIRKLKEEIADQKEAYQRLEAQIGSVIASGEDERAKVKEEVRLLLQRKNAELCELRRQNEKRLKNADVLRQNEISEVKYHCDKQMNNLAKLLQGKDRQLQKLKAVSQEEDKYQQKMIESLQREKLDAERRYEQRLDEQCDKYEKLRNHLNKLVCQTSQSQQDNINQMQKIFKMEYSQLFELIRIKDSEGRAMREQTDSLINLLKKELFTVQHQNQCLKDSVKQQAVLTAQQNDLLKLKMGKLHQTDVSQLKELYQIKLKASIQNMNRLDQDNRRLREKLTLEKTNRYQDRKEHEVAMSHLKAKILKLKMGMSQIEHDYKEKLDGQKSLMLMTSRSIIKEAENKTQNHKFLEEELRKLRQLLQLQNQQNENSEKALQEKISAAHNQLEMLSNRLVNIARDKKEIQQELEAVRAEKDRQIKDLREELLRDSDPLNQNLGQQMAIINDLKRQLGKKDEQIAIEKEMVRNLQSRIKQMQEDNQRYQMEARMNSQQARQQFERISRNHLHEYKTFYEDKVKRLEQQREQLKKLIGSQNDKIAQLVQRYRQMQQSMKQTLQMMKKRTVLEQKVLNIGMDANLMRNLTQLLPTDQQQQ